MCRRCANILRMRYGMMHMFMAYYKRFIVFETIRSRNNIVHKPIHSIVFGGLPMPKHARSNCARRFRIAHCLTG
jgi:hypothetical protein